jgi:hypothetical protein
MEVSELREAERSASEPQKEVTEFSLGLRRDIRKAGGFMSSVAKEESPEE